MGCVICFSCFRAGNSFIKFTKKESSAPASFLYCFSFFIALSKQQRSQIKNRRGKDTKIVNNTFNKREKELENWSGSVSQHLGFQVCLLPDPFLNVWRSTQPFLFSHPLCKCHPVLMQSQISLRGISSQGTCYLPNKAFCDNINFIFKTNTRFADFVLGGSHLSPEEVRLHEEQYGLGGAFLEEQLFHLRTPDSLPAQ